jgi:diadenylate cyclase
VSYHNLIQYLRQLANPRIYPRQQVLIELAIIFVLVYLLLRYLRGTRGGRAIKGLALVFLVITVLVKTLTSELQYPRLNFLYGGFLTVAAFMFAIVFQPELRRGFVRLGEARLFRGTRRASRVVEALAASAEYLSKNKVGALIALERRVAVKGVVEGGVTLDAEVSPELLNTLFWPGSALHDMGVIIQNGRIVAAGVQFPLAEQNEDLGPDLGSRHRAAIGLSLEGDALVIVVSEETGTISLAERGRLTRPLSPASLRELLIRGLGRAAIATDLTAEPQPAHNGTA